MAVRSRKYRMVLVPCLCVALIGWQFLAADAGPVSQIKHIKVNHTVSRFVTPASRVAIAHLDAMSRFASLLAPVSELPEDHWLLDDSTAPELAVHDAEAALGELAGDMGDDWTFWAAASFLVATQIEFALATYGLGLMEEANETSAAAEAAERAREVVEEQTEEAAEAAERVREVEEEGEEEATEAAAGADHLEAAAENARAQATQLPSEEQAEVMEHVNEVTKTDPAQMEDVFEQANAPAAGAGGAYNPTEFREQLVQAKRKLMLSLELDAALLATM